ncbi:hypothetical protein GCM10010844_18720 [Deinococcus radiotolerans]|uniref:Uncharacterized protein n=1 Tax=Deinococcus radiotolerans TaxID=1309407 RepID=A0ABQ2FL71_9DEIO|nr:hypothetical protein GCM10010844_18720 [Deinococcus radiotolerans]
MGHEVLQRDVRLAALPPFWVVLSNCHVRPRQDAQCHCPANQQAKYGLRDTHGLNGPAARVVRGFVNQYFTALHDAEGRGMSPAGLLNQDVQGHGYGHTLKLACPNVISKT